MIKDFIVLAIVTPIVVFGVKEKPSEDTCSMEIALNVNVKKATPKTSKKYFCKNKSVRDFVNKYKDAAVSEQRKSNIPASITLSQALLESSVGKSKLTKESNNFFGIKCFKRNCKDGHCVVFADDSPTDRFKVYKDASQSFSAHSVFLSKKRYDTLKGLGYKDFAKGLQKAGYATDPKYASKIISIIKKYKLNQFDEQ